MTYFEFLEFIFTPISYFVNWLSAVSNSLMSNYFFITILGITLIISLIYLVLDLFSLIRYKSKSADNYNNENFLKKGGK